jgi:site-specific DNA-methyltransferase (adenine-specific)/modification methylase
MRIFRHLWDGVCVAGGYETRNERCGQAAAPRHHPTQKPVDLMSWTIAQARVPAGGLIFDPYMGAGSTGIAAVLAGHPFIGVECEPVYFDAAVKRIEFATRQADLFAGEAA